MTDAPRQIPLKITQVSTDAWNTAVEATRATASLPIDGPVVEEWWNELTRTGIALQPGAVDPMWQAVINQAMSAPILFRVASTFRNMAYLADVSLGADVTTCLTRRLEVKATPSGNLIATAVDPQLEFSVTTADRPWDVVRRVVPPFDELRAAPRETTPEESRVQPLDPTLLAEARRSLDAPGLAPTISEVLGAKATVSVQTLVTPPGAPLYAPGICYKAWVLGNAGLFAIERDGESARVARVLPGDIGSTVLWFSQGGLDDLARAESLFADF